MTAFWLVNYLCLALVLVCGSLVIMLKSLAGSVMALSAMLTSPRS